MPEPTGGELTLKDHLSPATLSTMLATLELLMTSPMSEIAKSVKAAMARVLLSGETSSSGMESKIRANWAARFTNGIVNDYKPSPQKPHHGDVIRKFSSN